MWKQDSNKLYAPDDDPTTWLLASVQYARQIQEGVHWADPNETTRVNRTKAVITKQKGACNPLNNILETSPSHSEE